VDSILIRPERRGDGQGLALVWLDIANYYAEIDPERFQIPDAEGLADWFEQGLSVSKPEHRFEYVADLDGQVVGLVAALTEEPHASASRQLIRELSYTRLIVNALAVRRSFWRHGIGRQLLTAAEEWGRSRGATIALLDTYIRSRVSVPFYEQGMGYTRHSLNLSKHLM
jgi:GNAT superfamily N-acetyltransferase